MSEPKWPWRATFAHWAVGVLSPWLSLAPAPDPEDWPDDGNEDAAYDAGMERGYEEARREFEDRYDRDRW